MSNSYKKVGIKLNRNFDRKIYKRRIRRRNKYLLKVNKDFELPNEIFKFYHWKNICPGEFTCWYCSNYYILHKKTKCYRK